MTPHMAEAVATATSSGGNSAAVELPDRTRALDVASFERLLEQARLEQAHVEFGLPADHGITKSVAGVTRVIDRTSNSYVSAVDDSRAAVSGLDVSDPKSVAKVIDTLAVAAISGVQLTVMLNEVTSSKKALSELYHNQG